MAVIKSGNSTDQLTVDATSKAARVTQYDTAGNPLGTVSNPINVTTSGTPALPSGAATSANQTNGAQKTQLTDGTNAPALKQLNNQPVATDYGFVTNAVIHGLSSAGGGGYVDVKVAPSGAVIVDGSGSTQPVSGTVTANAGTGTFATQVTNFPATQAVSAASLPLPTGAATSANQTAVIDTPGSAIGAQGLLVGGSDGTNFQFLRTDAFGNLRVVDANPSTYSVTVGGFTPPATAGGIVFVLTGSATRTIRLQRLVVSGTQTTAGNVQLSIQRHTTAATGGTAFSPTAPFGVIAANDPNNGAATATVTAYTASPTAGTSAGVVYSARVLVPAPATAIGNPTVLDYNQEIITSSQPIILRGTTSQLSVRFETAVTFTATSCYVTCEWSEE